MRELQSRLAVWKVIRRRIGTLEATMVLDLDGPGFGLNKEREGRSR